MSFPRRTVGICCALPIVAALLVIFPLLPPGIPSTADGPLHLIRDVEYDALLRSGVLYPRWAPDLAYGYGYPLFNFYAPLFYYVAEVPHLLGASFQLALQLTIFFAILLYGLGPYWWTRPLLGDAAAAVTGVAYLYVPFRFHEAYMQGDYPQFLALALAPFAFGAVYRLFSAEQVAFRHVVMLTVALAAILLVHNISALWLAPTLTGYAVVLALESAGGGLPAARRTARKVIAAGGSAALALGLTAFFWLPALMEQNLVQLYRLRTDDYDVRHSFITLATLLAPPSVVDQTAANPAPFLHLGWGQLAMALATIPLIVLFLRRSAWQRNDTTPSGSKQPGSAGVSPAPGLRALSGETPALQKDSPRFDARPGFHPGCSPISHLVFGWLLLLTSAAMTLSLSAPVWRRIPLIAYTQFPWRVLELSGLATALLAGLAVALALGAIDRGRESNVAPTDGALVDRVPHGSRDSPADPTIHRARWSAVIVGLSLTVLIVPSLVYLYPRQPFYVYGSLTPSDVTAWERAGGAVGTTSTGEYYPIDVRVRPTVPLPTDLAKVGRLDRASLPVGAVVRFLGSAGYEERYALTLPSPTTIQFNLIRFAGWEVDVDGRPVATRSSPGEGLLLADLPAGAHQLTLRFVDTPIRRDGWLLALLSAVVLTGFGLVGLANSRRAKRASPTRAPASSRHRAFAPTLDRRGVVTIGAGVCGLIAVRALSPAPYAAVFARKSPLDRVIGVSHPDRILLEDRVEFLGYDLSDPKTSPGGAISVTLYWRALRPLTADYRSLAMIARVGDKGLVAQDDRVNPGGIPTHTWPTDRYVIDQHTIEIPASTPPMVYQLQVALYDGKTLKHLQQDGVSGWQGEQIVLRQIHVTRPTPVDPSTYRPLPGPVFGGLIIVLGYQINTDRPRSGQALELTLIWRAEKAVDHDFTVFTHLIDAKQNQAAGNDSMPIDGQYPTSTWLVGEDVVDLHRIQIPTSLAPGQYHLAFGLYDAKTLQRLPVTEKDWNAPRTQIDLDQLPIHVSAAR